MRRSFKGNGEGGVTEDPGGGYSKVEDGGSVLSSALEADIIDRYNEAQNERTKSTSNYGTSSDYFGESSGFGRGERFCDRRKLCMCLELTLVLLGIGLIIQIFFIPNTIMYPTRFGGVVC